MGNCEVDPQIWNINTIVKNLVSMTWKVGPKMQVDVMMPLDECERKDGKYSYPVLCGNNRIENATLTCYVKRCIRGSCECTIKRSISL